MTAGLPPETEIWTPPVTKNCYKLHCSSATNMTEDGAVVSYTVHMARECTSTSQCESMDEVFVTASA